MLSLTSEDILDEDTCIVCYEEEKLIDNFFCDCKFKYHRDCYVEWLKNNEYICIVCGVTIHPNHIDNMNQISDDLKNSQSDDKLSLIINDKLQESMYYGLCVESENVMKKNLNPIYVKICLLILILVIIIFILLIIYVFI